MQQKTGSTRGTGGRSKAAADRARAELQASIESAMSRLLKEGRLQSGSIAFRDPGDDGTVFVFRATGNRFEFAREVDSAPLLEISGDPKRLQAIIEGRKDAREQFFAGGISVRGDMHYLSELGMMLGFLKTPIV
jgi:predicted lipid carrier protein YhbT